MNGLFTKFRAMVAAIVVVVVIIGGGISLLFVTHGNTEPDQVGLWYKAGPLTSTKFDHCLNPGTRELFGGLADETYAYPAGQRTYDFSSNGKQDIPPIKVLTKNNLELTVSGIVVFNLTDDCETLRKFHEQIGLKDKGYMNGSETSDGWLAILSKYLQQSLQRALNEATQEFDWQELYNDVKVKAEWEKKVSASLPVFVKTLMGDEYFSNYTLTIQKPELPDDLLKALQDTQTAIQQNNAQKERNATVATELESIAKLVNILGPEGYNVYQAIKDGKINVMPIPSGSGVNLNAQAPAEAK